MAYKHGVYTSEMPTSVLPPVSVDSAIPFIVGTAPVGMSDESNVNRPVLCQTYGDFVKAFGFVPAEADSASGKKKFRYSLCEAAYTYFALYGAGPIICVNVLDPAEHRTDAVVQSITVPSTGTLTIEETGIIPSTVVISRTIEGEQGEEDTVITYVAGTDFELSWTDEGFLVVNALRSTTGQDILDAQIGETDSTNDVVDSSDSWLLPVGASLSFSAYKTDPGALAVADVIGGISASDGSKSGLELIEDVFPRLGVIPGVILCPGFSDRPSVAAVMAAKCTGINGLFRCVCVCDVPTGTVDQYSGVYAWKIQNGYTDPNQVVCWPMLELDGTIFDLSVHVGARMAATDGDNDGVPYVSPSNKAAKCTATVLADGTEVWLNNETASYLNGLGIVTAQNWTSGWVVWGNRTGVYPGSTDPKDAFIPVRRMFNWLANTLITTYWQRVDFPLNKRLVQTVVDSANIWLNGLAARQYILGGRVEFLESENPVTSLEDGICTFHLYVTPPTPAREIDFVLEYDVSYLSTLFE